jgi:hypothetical protein
MRDTATPRASGANLKNKTFLICGADIGAKMTSVVDDVGAPANANLNTI